MDWLWDKTAFITHHFKEKRKNGPLLVVGAWISIIVGAVLTGIAFNQHDRRWENIKAEQTNKIKSAPNYHELTGKEADREILLETLAAYNATITYHILISIAILLFVLSSILFFLSWSKNSISENKPDQQE